jgi:quinol monooxygenase YgiN
LIAGFVRFDPKMRSATLAAILEQVRETRKEPGFLQYVVAEDVEHADTLRVFEAWASWEALEAHFITPHMGRFRSQVGGLGVREFTLRDPRHSRHLRGIHRPTPTPSFSQ